jgi:protein O-GlcNAc transferase
MPNLFIRQILTITVALHLMIYLLACSENPSNMSFHDGLNDPCQTNKKCAISFGLFGDQAIYNIGALRNIELAPIIYPKWQLVFFVDPITVPNITINKIKHLGAIVKESPDYNNASSRFLIADEDFDIFIVRDVDSRLNERERAAVYEWIASDFLMHNMRDHSGHKKLVMGGLWGAKKSFITNNSMKNILVGWFKDNNGNKTINQYGADEEFLNYFAKKHVGLSNLMHHDSYYCLDFANSMPFPIERNISRHIVGQKVTENEVYIFFPQEFTPPIECRKFPFWRP